MFLMNFNELPEIEHVISLERPTEERNQLVVSTYVHLK
jgi:hypothetical protein